MTKKFLLSILLCLSTVGCIEKDPTPKPVQSPFVPEIVASTFLKKLEIHYTGLACSEDDGWGQATCVVNIDNKMQKIECYKRNTYENCSLVTK